MKCVAEVAFENASSQRTYPVSNVAVSKPRLHNFLIPTQKGITFWSYAQLQMRVQL